MNYPRYPETQAGEANAKARRLEIGDEQAEINRQIAALEARYAKLAQEMDESW